MPEDLKAGARFNPTENLTLHLRIGTEKLESRRCSRCGSDDFRAVFGILYGNGNTTTDHAIYNADKSDSSLALAVCYKCKRLVSLL